MNTNPPACLLLHGIAGSPFEVEPLAPGLRDLGCRVVMPTLPGHDTTVADFRATFFPDWLEHAEKAYLELKKEHQRVVVIGFSMGGALAMHLAARHGPAGLVTLAAPLYLYTFRPWRVRDWRLVFAPALRHIRPEVPVRRAKELSRAIAPFKGYEGVICLPQFHSLNLGLRPLRRMLPQIHCPALVMHDIGDRIVFPDCAKEIAESLSSPDVRLHYTRVQETVTSHHMITTHRETREFVADAVTGFVRRIAENGKA